MKAQSIFLTIILLSTFSNCFSQFQYISFEKAEALSKRTVIIELFDELTEEEKKANKYLINYFQSNLKIGQEVICKNRGEIKELLKEDQEKYAILTHELGNHTIKTVNRYRTIKGERTTASDPNGIKYNRIMATLNHYDLTLTIVSANKKIDGHVTEVDFIHYKLRPEDYIFASFQFNRLYNASLSKKRQSEYYSPTKAIETLKTKVLLVDKKNIEFTPEQAKGYDFEHKFVDYDVIEKAILEKEHGKVYALMLWSEQLQANDWVIVDTETGEIYSQVTHGGINYDKFGEYEPPAKMKEIHFKSFDSVLANKINNRYK